MIMWLIVIGLAALIVVLFRKHLAEHRELEKYKFDHRTSGGVVEFENYEEKSAFDKREQKHRGRQMIILFLCVIFIICFSGVLFLR